MRSANGVGRRLGLAAHNLAVVQAEARVPGGASQACDALICFESIRRDLYAESYDVATIDRRLTELETTFMLPSYVFTLLNRRAAAHRLTPSAG
jgi:hypothetical protein